MQKNSIQQILASHNQYWEQRREKMESYLALYKAQMFRNTGRYWRDSNIVTVETADAYAFIETFVSGLFQKAPSTAVGADPSASSLGDEHVVEILCNRFLYETSELFEDATRLALIFPAGFLKMGLTDAISILDQVNLRPVQPWNIILDLDASSWTDQRYIGHRYWVPLNEAKSRFGNKQFTTASKPDFLNDNNGTEFDSFVDYVEIIELYDLENDELIFYSSNYSANEGVLTKAKGIPFRAYDGTPTAPIAPIYMGKDPTVPLAGLSRLGLLYDAFWETNNLRTVWANGLRRDARMYATRKGTIDEEGKSMLAENRDQSIIELDLNPDQNPAHAIVPLMQNTFSPDYHVYKAEIRQDIDRGSILAPFTRGVASGATATEIAALSQYSASEIGKLARSRDKAQENICKIYISILKHLLETKPNNEARELIKVNNETILLSAELLTGKFKYSASDSSASPLSSSLKKQSYLELLPTLASLGVPQTLLLQELVEKFDLPPTFMDAVEEANAEAQVVAAQPLQAEEADGLSPHDIRASAGEPPEVATEGMGEVATNEVG